MCRCLNTDLPGCKQNIASAVLRARATPPETVQEMTELANRISGQGPDGPQSWSNEDAMRLAELVLQAMQPKE